MRENRSERVCDSRHRLDENVERNTNDVFTRIADRIAGNRGFVRRRAFSMACEQSRFDVFFRVVERAARIAHENRSRYRNYGRPEQQSADELDAEDNSAEYREDNCQY